MKQRIGILAAVAALIAERMTGVAASSRPAAWTDPAYRVKRNVVDGAFQSAPYLTRARV